MQKWGQSHSPPAEDVEREGMRFLVFHSIKKTQNFNNEGNLKKKQRTAKENLFHCPFFFFDSTGMNGNNVVNRSSF